MVTVLEPVILSTVIFSYMYVHNDAELTPSNDLLKGYIQKVQVRAINYELGTYV